MKNPRHNTVGSSFGMANGVASGTRLLMAGFFVLAALAAPAAEAEAKMNAPVKTVAVKTAAKTKAPPIVKKPAPPVGTFKAKELLRSSKTLEMEVGTTTEFAVTFKNVGTAAWSGDGAYFVSVYTQSPKYRSSDFSDMSWPDQNRPARLDAAKVKPGQTATFRFLLFAPIEEGAYHETFQLASEDLAWIDGGQFTVDVNVKRRVAVGGGSGIERSFAPGYKAEMLLVSDRGLILDAGATRQIKVGFKNTGKTSWKNGGSLPLALRVAENTYLFHDASWSNDIVTPLTADEVKPGQLAFFTFTVAAPTSGGGTFKPRFTLTAGDGLVDGGEVEIPIEVRLGTQSPQIDQMHDSEYARSGPRGPNIVLGLFTTRGQVRLAAAGAYSLLDADDVPVKDLSGVTTVSFDFAAGAYAVRNGDYVYTTAAHVSFRPLDPASTIFEVPSYENRPTWDPTVNFNRFRGTLTVHYVKATDRLWVKETLPLEDYLRGLAETTNASPYEFQKALVTAARTYALFVLSIGGKHKSEYFDLDATGNDQVYKGYASELARPNVVRAVEETRGIVVTYAGDIVVTPYFSRSDGRTRSWSEVWHGSNPWLVTRPAPYDVGKTLWGHGVGMSASDAVGRANAGTNWQDILKYYYSGIELKGLY